MNEACESAEFERVPAKFRAIDVGGASVLDSIQITPPGINVKGFFFTITNPSSVPITFAVTASATNGFQVNDYIGRDPPFDPWYVTVGAGQIGSISINIRSPNVVGVTGAVTATASYVNSSGVTLSGSGTYTNVITTNAGSSTTHSFSVIGSGLQMAPNAVKRDTFFVKNIGTTTDSVGYGNPPGCTGSAIASCGAPDHNGRRIQPGLTDTVWFSVAAGTAPGQTGSTSLTANVIGAPGVSFTGSASVSTGFGSGPLTISSAAQTNTGPSIARDACLTIAAGAAGSGAAYECGDLRLVHPLPTTTTLNKPRTPALIYTSGHAPPVARVSTDISIDGSICPGQISVYVVFPLSHDSVLKSVTWNGTCGQQATRRVVVPIDAQAHSLTTGVYPYLVHVSTTVSGTTYAAMGDTAQLAVVNRASNATDVTPVVGPGIPTDPWG
ncbi:MAG TPA: hypothetical protein VGQ56_11555 [Gemmatimonadaceae bacterium]|jgi:hypothetical protein|nr:hypothetical protein [Gemmatimonadaceae bacterium]